MNELSPSFFAKSFEDLSFETNERMETPRIIYSKVKPEIKKNSELIAWSESLARELGVEQGNEELQDLLGARESAKHESLASCYGGHQFGHWAGQLGDGRAMIIGDIESSKLGRMEVQLKGAGSTPYSRRADGKAVMRSSVREYLASEAMHCLGVPTTRALSLFSSGEKVLRDMFYDGNARHEPGAIVARVAKSFLRFGTFELMSARGEMDNLERLIKWSIDHYFPDIDSKADEAIVQWFESICLKTSKMIVQWMRIGFVHGVMNTDNMSILGLTIDYGPYSFIDKYDPTFTPNTTDLPGRRYAFSNQPHVALWNLLKLAEAISPLVKNVSELEGALTLFKSTYAKDYGSMMRAKLGVNCNDNFIKKTLSLMHQLEFDYTLFFKNLKNIKNAKDFINIASYQDISVESEKRCSEYLEEYSKYSQNLGLMDKSNPQFILRNYALFKASEDMEKGDQECFRELEKSILLPYQEKNYEWNKLVPKWASEKKGCTMLSCSS